MEQNAHEVPSLLFLNTFCKRSRETPAREHPSAEEEEVQKHAKRSSPEHDVESPVATYPPSLQDQERNILVLISQTPAHFDDLCLGSQMPAPDVSSSLTMLELSGLITRMPGDSYVLAKSEANFGTHGRSDFGADTAAKATDQTVKTTDKNEFENFVGWFSHGISRKYLQNYLAAFWCYKDRKRWSPQSLFVACVRYGYISYEEILLYVSPPIVKFPKQQEPNASVGT
jgi:hypothetical protein